MEKDRHIDIGNNHKNSYNRNSKRNPEHHGPGSENHHPPSNNTEPEPCPHDNDTTRPDRTTRRATRPHHRTARGHRTRPVTIHQVETHPMTAADEKEAIQALATLLAQHQSAASPTNHAHAPG
jgi:hypothetical protein